MTVWPNTCGISPNRDAGSRMKPIFVTDSSDVRLNPYRNLPERTLRGESVFLAEGDLLVTRLLQSRFRTLSIVAVERFLTRITEPIPEEVPIYLVDEKTIQTVTGFGFYQGIMAVGQREWIPETKSLLQTNDENGCWVILPNTLKPDNLGLIFRACAALEANGVILGERCCDPFSRRTLRVSMGGVLQVPVYKSENLADDLLLLRNRAGFDLIATVLDKDAVSLYKCNDWAKRVGFVFGHEFSGLEDPWLSCCTKKTMIPMAEDVDSLNLGVSVGIFLYEYRRQRFET